MGGKNNISMAYARAWQIQPGLPDRNDSRQGSTARVRMNRQIDYAKGIQSQRASSEGRITISIVAMFTGIEKKKLMNNNRGQAFECQARHLAMYLMHTSFSCSFADIGRFFGRDRTTVAHACKLIEDRRDDRAFDIEVGRIENLLQKVRQLAESGASRK